MVLSDEHKELPITKNQAVLDLVAKTGNFIPTPSAQQLARNVRLSLNIFTIRVFNQFSGHVHRKLIQDGKDAEAREGIPPWKPKKFGYNDAWYAERKTWIFSNKNRTWQDNFVLCPTLPAVLEQFEKETMAKTEAIVGALRKRKWQNLHSVPAAVAVSFCYCRLLHRCGPHAAAALCTISAAAFS